METKMPEFPYFCSLLDRDVRELEKKVDAIYDLFEDTVLTRDEEERLSEIDGIIKNRKFNLLRKVV